MQEIIFWLTCGVYLVAALALIQRTRSTGDVGYVVVGGVVFGVPLVVHLLAAYCFIAEVRQHTSKPAIDLMSHSFDQSILPLTALGLVIALYVLFRRNGSSGFTGWLWPEEKADRVS